MRKALSILLAASILAVVLFAWRQAWPPVTTQVPVRIPGTIATEEDPQARFRFEWQRLHDPATGRIPEGIRQRELAFARTLPARDGLDPAKTGLQPFDWIPRGPVNLGGRTRALGIDVANEDVILAGGVSGGMWRTEDGGKTWVETTGPDQHHSVTCLAQDTRPGQTDVWYFGSGELVGNSASANGAPYTGRGVYRSTDGGRSWALTGLREDTPEFDSVLDAVYNVAVDPTSTGDGEVYAAVYGIIYRSTDGGATWSAVLGGESNRSEDLSVFTDVAVTSTGVVYAALSSDGTTAGLWRSPDGVTWTNITPPGWPAAYDRTVIGAAPSNPDAVYFLAETPGIGAAGHSLWKYVYRSGDGTGEGARWSDRSEHIPTDEDFPDNFAELDVGGFDSQGGYDLLVDVRPDDEDVVFIGGTNLYRSTDGFTSGENVAWIGGYHPTEFLYPNHHPDLHVLAFYPSNPNRMLSGDDGGVQRTEDNMAQLSPETPVRWTSLNNGYLTTQFYSVAIDEATPGDPTIIGGMQDNGTFFTNENTGKLPWIGDLLGGDGSFADIVDGRAYYYASAQQAQIYRLQLSDAGTLLHFARVDPPQAQFGTALFITPFMLDPANQNRMFLGGGDRVWRNNDLLAIPNGNLDQTLTGWDVLSNTGGDGAVVTAVRPVTVREGDSLSTRLYYATYRGQNPGGVYRMDDAAHGDPVPREITGPDFPPGAYVSCIAVNPDDPDHVLVVFSNYNVESLFSSEDGGDSWTAVGGNLEEREDGEGSGPSTRWVEILPRLNGTVYFVATSTGLYSTTGLNGVATTWVQEGAEVIGNVVVDMVDGRQVDGFVVAGTHGTGVYSAVVPDLLEPGVDPGDDAPAFVIMPPFPNPFDDETHFVLMAADAQEVRVEVYDEAGRRVAVLFDGPLAAGASRRLTFAPAGLSSGVYFFRITGETFATTTSAVYVR